MSQAAESSPGGTLDGGEPGCHEPSEKDTGRSRNQPISDFGQCCSLAAEPPCFNGLRHFMRHFMSHPISLCLVRSQPTGLLAYLDSPDPVPEKDMDRMHIRDNLKLAQVSAEALAPHLYFFAKCTNGSIRK